MKNKTCNRCGVDKPITGEHFHKLKNSKDGFAGICKKCKSEVNKAYRDKNNNKEYQKKYHKKYREENAEELKKYKDEYYKENREELIEDSKDYYQENKETLNRARIKYYNKNREDILEKAIIRNQRYKAEKSGLPNDFTIDEWKQVLEYFDNSCAYCRTHQDDLEQKLEQEHIVPAVSGGGYTRNNIIPACKQCNSNKNMDRFEEWYPKQDYFYPERYNTVIYWIKEAGETMTLKHDKRPM